MHFSIDVEFSKYITDNYDIIGFREVKLNEEYVKSDLQSISSATTACQIPFGPRFIIKGKKVQLQWPNWFKMVWVCHQLTGWYGCNKEPRIYNNMWVSDHNLSDHPLVPLNTCIDISWLPKINYNTKIRNPNIEDVL